MRYSLRDDGYPFKKIMHNGKWVGRVVKHATKPCYVGRIGNDCVEAPTEVGAFELVAARAMGFDSPAQLRSKNRQVRHARQVKRAIGDALAREFIHAPVAKQIDIIDKAFATAEGTDMLLGGITRSFRRA